MSSAQYRFSQCLCGDRNGAVARLPPIAVKLYVIAAYMKLSVFRRRRHLSGQQVRCLQKRRRLILWQPAGPIPAGFPWSPQWRAACSRLPSGRLWSVYGHSCVARRGRPACSVGAITADDEREAVCALGPGIRVGLRCGAARSSDSWA